MKSNEQEIKDISAEIATFCIEVRTQVKPDCDEFFASLALEQAAIAAQEGNFGIGACLVEVSEKERRVFLGRNVIFSGDAAFRERFGAPIDGILKIAGHAEAFALFRYVTAEKPDFIFAGSGGMPLGVTMYGTLEPCPLCTVLLTNERRVLRSISISLDDPSAYAVGSRDIKQPEVWTKIQVDRGLKFGLLETVEPRFNKFSRQLADATVKRLDAILATRN